MILFENTLASVKLPHVKVVEANSLLPLVPIAPIWSAAAVVLKINVLKFPACAWTGPRVSAAPPVFMVKSVPVESSRLGPVKVMTLPPEEKVVNAPACRLKGVVAV